ncbi:MAG TPA: acetate--CoA ligase [Terriglobales bacterium]|jgi:acetyl-CoA synthetase|nr:acetate--CoA ligase [Terriglobales bacterium]
MIETGAEFAMIRNSTLRMPDPDRAAKTNAGSVAAFKNMLERSLEDPDHFWAKAASELEWLKPWHTARKGELPHFEYFCGGIANPCANMLDRHLSQGADNKTALIWESESFETKFYTYRMLYHEVNRFANVLINLGLKKGDPIAIFLPNVPEAVIAVLACFRLGVIFNTIFSGFSSAALRTRIEVFEPKLVLTADAIRRRGKLIPLKAEVDEAIQGLESVRTVAVVKRTGTPANMQSGRDFWWDDLMLAASVECLAEPLEANEPGLVFYTSGTTGKPKGVIHSGIGFLVNAYIYAKYHLDHHANDVFWCTADIGWLTMHIWGIVGALANGVTTIFYDGALDWPQPDHFYKVLQKYHVNKLMTAPTLIRGLMRHGERLAEACVLNLDTICVLGEPLNPEAWHWTNEKLGRGRAYINNLWGQTELGGCPLAGAAWLTPMKPGSCGGQFLGAHLDVVDDEGRSLGPNTSGNLVVRAPFPAMTRGLWKEPERFIREYFQRIPGCYCTYDAAVRDEDGHFWVVGRTDDVINVAGHRLSTMEIESAIMECEGVAETAVVGVPDELKGSIPVAFILLQTRCAPTAELREKVCRRIEAVIGKIAVPGFIYFSDVLPKTSSGKIMRRLLKEIVITGAAHGDTTGLEDAGVVEKIRRVLEGTQPTQDKPSR